MREYEIHPEDFGLHMKSNRGLQGQGRARVEGDDPGGAGNVDGTPREIVVLNAGTALYAAGVASDIEDGIRRARESIASGAAKRALERFVATTQKLATPA